MSRGPDCGTGVKGSLSCSIAAGSGGSPPATVWLGHVVSKTGPKPGEAPRSSRRQDRAARSPAARRHSGLPSRAPPPGGGNRAGDPRPPMWLEMGVASGGSLDLDPELLGRLAEGRSGPRRVDGSRARVPPRSVRTHDCSSSPWTGPNVERNRAVGPRSSRRDLGPAGLALAR